MKKNLINELGELALSTRLTRISEITRKDVSRIYKEHGIEFESKWFPVLFVLSKRSPLSVIELSEELGYAHPSVIALVKEMEKKKLIKSVSDKSDRRKRMLRLTPHAVTLSNKMKPLWKQMRVVAKQIYNNKYRLLLVVEEVEEAFQKKSYYDRYKALVMKNKTRQV